MADALLVGPSSDVPENIDYDFAQQELMLQQMEDDPIQGAIRSIEKQHQEDKQGKLCSLYSARLCRKHHVRKKAPIFCD